jgi:hypothetical protein
MEKYILLGPNCWHQFQVQHIQRRELRLVDGGNSGRKAGEDAREEQEAEMIAVGGIDSVEPVA